MDLPPAVRGMSRGQSRSSMLDTADGTLTLTLTRMCRNVWGGRSVVFQILKCNDRDHCPLVPASGQEVEPFACFDHSSSPETFSVLH